MAARSDQYAANAVDTTARCPDCGAGAAFGRLPPPWTVFAKADLPLRTPGGGEIYGGLTSPFTRSGAASPCRRGAGPAGEACRALGPAARDRAAGIRRRGAAGHAHCAERADIPA